MRKYIYTFLFLALRIAALGQAMLPVTGTKAVDNANQPLTGSLVFTVTDAADNPVTYTPSGGTASTSTIVVTVKNGVIQNTGGYPPTIPNPATMSPANTRYRIQGVLADGCTVVYTLPLTNITTDSFTMDSYQVPATVTATGLGRPMIACAPGAQYAESDVSYAYNWVCSQLRSDQSVYWTQNPYLSPNVCPQPRMAFVSNRFGAPFCVDSLDAFATPNMVVGNSSNAPAALTLIPYTPGSVIAPTTVLLKGTTSGGATPAGANDVASLLSTAAGCATSGYVYSPASGTCIAPGVTPVGQQYRLGAYTGTGSGSNTQLGQSNAYTDATGNPLTIPGLLTTQAGSASVASNCTQVLLGGISACDTKNQTFFSPSSPSGNQSLFANLYSYSDYGGGAYVATPGRPADVFEGTRSKREDHEDIIARVAGGFDYTTSLISLGLGDKFVSYAYLYGFCSIAFSSDEGCGVNAANFEESETNMVGTVSSYDSASGAMVTVPSAGHTSWVVDGTRIDDMASGQSVTGNLTAASAAGDMANMRYLTTTATLPQTTSRCQAVSTDGTTDVFSQTATIRTYQTVTLNCTVFPVGGSIIGGVVTGGTYAPMVAAYTGVLGDKIRENGRILSVGTMDPTSHVQSITLSVMGNSGPHVSFWQGGFYDGDFTLDANDAITNVNYYHSSPGSITGHDLQYSELVGGHYGSVVLPDSSMGPQTTDGGANSGFTLHHGATITAITDFDNMYFNIEQSEHTWTSATVQDMRYPYVAVKVLAGQMTLVTPCVFEPCSAVRGYMTGTGASGRATTVTAENQSPDSEYYGAGGKLVAPTGVGIHGDYNTSIEVRSDPYPDALGAPGALLRTNYTGNLFDFYVFERGRTPLGLMWHNTGTVYPTNFFEFTAPVLFSFPVTAATTLTTPNVITPLVSSTGTLNITGTGVTTLSSSGSGVILKGAVTLFTDPSGNVQAALYPGNQLGFSGGVKNCYSSGDVSAVAGDICVLRSAPGKLALHNFITGTVSNICTADGTTGDCPGFLRTGVSANTDTAGNVTLALGSTTSPTITFTGTYAVAPVCTFFTQNATAAQTAALGVIATQVSTTTASAVVSTAPAADITLGYMCVGRN